MKNLPLVIVSGAVFIAYLFNFQSILEQNNPLLAVSGFAIIGTGFLVTLIRFIKGL